jgi:hypothetical protein
MSILTVHCTVCLHLSPILTVVASVCLAVLLYIDFAIIEVGCCVELHLFSSYYILMLAPFVHNIMIMVDIHVNVNKTCM